MITHFQEFVDSRAAPLDIDREKGVLRGVKILGLRSKNGRNYAPDALQRAVPLYEGAKVNVNHAKGDPNSPRDYQDRIGTIRDVVFREHDGLFAEFHFNPRHALADQLAWDAANAPENVGFSHNVRAKLRQENGQPVVEEIVSVQSVDLVADPATTQGLFEEVGAASNAHADAVAQLTLEQLQADRPDLIEALLESRGCEFDQLHGRLSEAESRLASVLREKLICDELRRQGLASHEPNGVGERFLEALMSATDETLVREMIEEHAALMRRRPTGKPTSREQAMSESPCTTEDFVRRIARP